MTDVAAARDLLARLVAFPTIAGESNEELVAWTADLLDAAGAQVREVAATRPGARNLRATIGPPDVPGALLAGHTDVVAVDGQAWSADPFVLREHGGRLYGRGTTDMKGFVAAALAVAPEAGRRRLRRPLHLALSADEELGCVGVAPLLEELRRAVAPPAWCVVGEPTGMRVAERHKGKVALRVEVRGRAVHSARAPEGVNAVEYAARLIAGLRELRDALRREAADPAFATPFATLSTGPIHGGVALNIVPERCTFDVEVRTLPGQDGEAAVAEIQARARALEAEMRASAPEASVTVTRTAGYPALGPGPARDAAEQVATLAGSRAGLAVDFGTEAGLYRAALGVPVVVCGPGDMARAHRPDEFITDAELAGAVAFARRVVATLAENV